MTVVEVAQGGYTFSFGAHCLQSSLCKSTQMVILPSALLASDSTLKVMGIEGGNDGEITLYSLHNVSIHLKKQRSVVRLHGCHYKSAGSVSIMLGTISGIPLDHWVRWVVKL